MFSEKVSEIPEEVVEFPENLLAVLGEVAGVLLEVLDILGGKRVLRQVPGFLGPRGGF